jgi:hypothetical protein
MPVGYALVRTIQMTDSFGPVQSRVFYGFVAVGGAPKTAVVALRGTATTTEWWNDFQWDLVPFTQVPNCGNVAQGFCDIYDTFGTMIPGQQHSAPAPATFAADVAAAVTEGLAAEVGPAGLPIVVTGHSLGGALATLLVADLTATTPLKPQAWTFASPNVGDAAFAARYGALSTVSWRIYNEHGVLADLQPSRRRPVLSRRHLRPLSARHHRVRNQLPGEGELEPGLRPRAEHLPARAVARHGAAGPGLPLAARYPPRPSPAA